MMMKYPLKTKRNSKQIKNKNMTFELLEIS